MRRGVFGNGGIECLRADDIPDGVEESEALVTIGRDESHTTVYLLFGCFNVKDEGGSAVLLQELDNSNVLDRVRGRWEVIAGAIIGSLAGIEGRRLMIALMLYT